MILTSIQTLMKSNYPIQLFLIALLITSVMSCGESAKKETDQESPALEKTIEDSPEPQSEKEKTSKTSLTTKTGRIFEIETQNEGASVMNITVSPKDFPNSTDSWKIEGADPLSESFTADLDENGFEELYLVTRSVGTGSYARIYGYASNRDLSATPIYVPEPSESDMAQGGAFFGYMGHDSIFMDEGRLYRKFPVYREGDENCCPTGGDRRLEYELIPGEASWILRIKG